MALVGLVQEAELGGAVHERRLWSRQTLAGLEDLQEAVGLHGAVEALELVEQHLLGLDRVAGDPPGDAVQEDLVSGGMLLQAGREVDRRADHERLARAPIARHDVPRRDAGADRELHVPPGTEIIVGVVDQQTEIPSGPDRPQGVVLVRTREPEHGHDRIADELLDAPTVPADRGPRRVEVPADHLVEGFGVQPMRQVGRPRQVGEQDRHLAAGLRRLGRVQRVPARQAEPSVLGIVGGARGTDRHGRKPTAARDPMGPRTDVDTGQRIGCARGARSVESAARFGRGHAGPREGVWRATTRS